ncbi:hypothetical protein EBZ02_09255, partial [bacterium]|nr:hypothetical protein [bacterium]
MKQFPVFLFFICLAPGFAAESPAIDSTQVEFRSDVPFLAEGRTEKLDLYLPKNRKAGETSPAILLIHGGG